MKKRTIILALFLSCLFGQDNIGIPFVDVNQDTVQFGVNDMYRNCGALFDLNILQEENIFTVTAIDTGGIAWCYCTFDIHMDVSGISPGNYTAQFYSYDLNGIWIDSLSMFGQDTVYIGDVSFVVEESGDVFSVLSAFQSPCEETFHTDETDVPNRFTTLQNYPNPFNSKTMIGFSIPKNGLVTIVIYDMLGNVITTLIMDKLPAGNHLTMWNAENYPSGIYFLRMTTKDLTKTRKLLYLK